MARETLDFIPSDVQSDKCEISKKKKNWPNYKLHFLSMVKVQFNPLRFDPFNLVL